MKINTQSSRFWTFDSLIGAFVDLFIAYFLLCASTIALFAVKFLAFFNLNLPTPYNGLFGSVSSDYKCLLVDYPTDKVSSVQFSAATKFPFDSILFGLHNNDDHNQNNDDVEFEDEGSCSLKSNGRKVIGNENDDVGFDLKGKGVLNYGIRGGSRSKRKVDFDNGSVSSCSNWVTCVDQHSNYDDEQSGGHVSDVNNCIYEAETPMVVKPVSRYDDDIVTGDSNDAQKRILVNEADKDKEIVLLRRELEESQGARAALYVELEKERSAAATAADEAMSMILRLQEEKASTKMELQQYRRMIEEKSAFDAEEMNILKEIVLRREREKHFLEKQVEMYGQMIQNDEINVGNDHDFTQDPDLMLTFQNKSDLYGGADFSKQEEIEKTIAIVGENKDLEIKPDDASVSSAYDVYVNDQEPKSSEKNDPKQSGSETSVGVMRSKSSLRRNSTSALDNERTRLDTEVEWLRERLRIVQDGRGKLKFSVENREKESLQLELLEDIARQLHEIRMITGPQTARQASPPIPSSKPGWAKKRRCKSVSSGLAKSS